ncbi:type II toxin-antitoxin system death-on-curing family toxin [Marinithermofilum abyssi]
MVQDHPFHNGNKRTALSVLSTFLRMNGYILTLTNEQAEELMVAVADDKRYRGEDGLDLLAVQIRESLPYPYFPISSDSGPRTRFDFCPYKNPPDDVGGSAR